MQVNRRRRVVTVLAPLVWMYLIYVVSSQPSVPSLDIGWMDRTAKAAAHFGEYAVLAVLLALRPLSGGTRLSRRQAAAVLAVAVFYALSDEYHQRFVPGRVADWADIAADSAGAGLALLLLRRDGPARHLRHILRS